VQRLQQLSAFLQLWQHASQRDQLFDRQFSLFYNANGIWTFTDNVSKVGRKHIFKFGVYTEHNYKLQPSGSAIWAASALRRIR